MKPRTGHIFKRGKSWYGRVSYTDDEGKRRFVKRAARTRSEAREKLNELIREIEDRGSVDGSRMTFNELAKRFEEVKLVPARYVRSLKKFVENCGFPRSAIYVCPQLRRAAFEAQQLRGGRCVCS